eukprot:g54914.t1
MYGDTPYCNVFVDNITGLLRNYWCKTRDQNATLEQVKQLQARHQGTSEKAGVERHLSVRDDPNKDAYAEAGIKLNIAREKSGKSAKIPESFFTDDEWLVIQRLADEVASWSGSERYETSALPTEARPGVDGGDAELSGGAAELKTRGALLTLLPPEWKTRRIGMVCRFHGMGQL